MLKLPTSNDRGGVAPHLPVANPGMMAALDAAMWTGDMVTTGPATTMYVDNRALIPGIESRLGYKVTAFTAFTDQNTITSNTFPFTNQWPNGEKLVLSHCISQNGWNMATAAAGGFDSAYQTCVDNLLPYKNRILAVRIGWEFNATGAFPWNIGGNGSNQNAANYVAAFQRFARYWRRAMPDVLIEWCPLWDNAAADTWYPGNEFVDIIGNDVYLNSAFWSDSFTNALSQANCSLQWQENFANTRGKFMSFPEWSSNYNTGTFVSRMLEWMSRPRVNRVIYQGYWNSSLNFNGSFANNPVNEAAYYGKLAFAP